MRCWSLLFLMVAAGPVVAPSSVMGDTFVYVSVSGEKQIRVYSLSDDGKLKPQTDTKLSGDPGVLWIDARRNLLIAAVRSAGRIETFNLDSKTGALRPLDTIHVGANPVWVSADRTGRWVLSAYYNAGKVSVHRLRPGGKLTPWPAHSVATSRFAHGVAIDPSNQFLLVPHTRPNTIRLFHFSEHSGLLRKATPSSLQTGPQTGPRHAAFHPRLPVAYADNEQGSSVTAFDFDPSEKTLRPGQTLSTLPTDFSGNNTCARMALSTNGRMLFVSNRGHDSIASFRVDPRTGGLSATGHYATEKTPRGFGVSPDDRWLVVAGQASGNIASYRINADNNGHVLSRVHTVAVGRRPSWVSVVTLQE